MLEKLHQSFLVILILFLFFIPVYNKFKWNHKEVTIGSDPQIKYYQSFSFYKDGISKRNLECYFPAEKLGFTLNYIPIGYPWAFVNSNHECFFQYPILMPLLHALIGKLFSFNLVLYIPIFFFLLNFIISIKILQLFGLNFQKSIYLSLYIHFLTPIFLSSLDYSEVTLTNTFLLLTLFYYEKQKRNKVDINLFQNLLCGLLIAVTFQLRPEVTISVIILFFVGFLFNFKQFSSLRMYVSIGFFFLIFTIGACYLNYTIYHHPLGMRGLNTIQDSQILMLNQYIQNWISDIWGSDFKIGIIKAYPILFFLALFGIFRSGITKTYNHYLISGITFLLLLPILSPYRAGVDIMGLRYYESGVYLLSFGSLAIIFKDLNITSRISKIYLVVLILFVLVSSYFGYKSNLRAIKHWAGAAKVSNEFSERITQLNPEIIIHRGLSTTYLMGVSYLKVPQIVIYSQKDWDDVEKTLVNRKLKRVLFLYWEGNHLVNDEFPSKIWKSTFDINFILQTNRFWMRKEVSLIHFKGLLLQQEL